jgi:hypothetical protein
MKYTRHTWADILALAQDDPVVHACLAAQRVVGASREETLIEIALSLEIVAASLRTRLLEAIDRAPIIVPLDVQGRLWRADVDAEELERLWRLT